jgi:hypothetical protein
MKNKSPGDAFIDKLKELSGVEFQAFSSSSHRGVRGDGIIKSEDRPVSEFSNVIVTGGYKVQWSGGEPALTISADQNLLPLIRTVVHGDTLQIDSKENLIPSEDVTVVLSSHSLAGVKLTGGNRFIADHISGPELKVESTGASNISVDGSVTDLQATMTGASKLDAKSLQTQSAYVSLAGASRAEVSVSDALKVSIAGAGSVTYSGNPKTVKKSVAGAGFVRHRE